MAANTLNKTREEVEEIKEEISRLYEVTRDGKVFNIQRGTELKFPSDKKGYKIARLRAPAISKNKDRRIPVKMHRLVAMFHLKEFDPSLQVNHKNGIKHDNRVENLEMVTGSQNVFHAWNVLDSKKRRIGVAERRTGAKHSEETKQKQSLLMKKWWKEHPDHRHTDESKSRMSRVAKEVWKKRKSSSPL